jgi:hypothetical protein
MDFFNQSFAITVLLFIQLPVPRIQFQIGVMQNEEK